MSESRKNRLENILLTHFAPSFFEVVNESYLHRVPADAETHFKVLIVSAQFLGLSRLARQRLIYQHLQTELSSGLHALSLQTFTPEEWQQSPNQIASPPCAHQTSNS